MKREVFKLLWNFCFVILWFIGTEKMFLQQASARGRELYAVELDSPPVIDGAVKEFYKAWGGEVYLEENAMVFHPERWKDGKDLSADISIGWDEQNLYFTFKIRDNQVVFAKNPEQLLKSDHVEIWLDTQFDADNEDTKMSADDLQLAIGMTQDGQPIIADWSPRRKRNETLERSVKAASRRYVAGKYPGGYAVEVAIPLALLKINPIRDRRIGILLDVSDADDADNPRQDKMLSSSQERRFRNPTSFNTLIFTFNHVRLPFDRAAILDKYEQGLARRIETTATEILYELGVERFSVSGFESPIIEINCSIEEIHFTNQTIPDLLINMSVRGTWWKDLGSLVFVLKKENEYYEIIFMDYGRYRSSTKMEKIDINENDGVVELFHHLYWIGFNSPRNDSSHSIVIHKYIDGKMKEIWKATLEEEAFFPYYTLKNEYELFKRAGSDYKAIRLTLNYEAYINHDLMEYLLTKQHAENIYVWDGEKYIPEGKEYSIADFEPQTIPRLIDGLGDENVRFWAAKALGYMGNLAKDAAPALIKVLNDEDEDEYVREEAAKALAQIDTHEARKALEDYKSKGK